jgi:hypothetical protein
MGKKHFRPLGVALTLAGAVVAICLLVVPAALGVSSGGKFTVQYYTDAKKGNKVTKVGPNQKFIIVGTNLGKAVEVFCYAGKDDDDNAANSPKGLDDIEDWTVDATGHMITAEEPDPDCAGHRGPITVLFSNGAYVNGPDLAVNS